MKSSFGGKVYLNVMHFNRITISFINRSEWFFECDDLPLTIPLEISKIMHA